MRKNACNFIVDPRHKVPSFTSNATSLAIKEIFYYHRLELLSNDLLPVKRHVLLNQPLLLFPSTTARHHVLVSAPKRNQCHYRPLGRSFLLSIGRTNLVFGTITHSTDFPTNGIIFWFSVRRI